MKVKLIILFFTSILLISCNSPTINGRVVDYFKAPIEGVKIIIEGTSIQTTSNSNGEYHLDFVPGVIKIKYSKDGYIGNNLTLNIAQKENFPAKEIQLILLPQNRGIFYLDKQSKKYYPLTRTSFTTSKIKTGKQLKLFSGTTYEYKKSYFAQIDENEIIKVNKGNIEFMDNRKPVIFLVKLNKVSNKKYKIMSVRYYTRWAFSNDVVERVRRGDFEQYLINEKSERKYKPYFIIRKCSLSKGYYAYYACNGIRSDVIGDPFVYVFKVE